MHSHLEILWVGLSENVFWGKTEKIFLNGSHLPKIALTDAPKFEDQGSLRGRNRKTRREKCDKPGKGRCFAYRRIKRIRSCTWNHLEALHNYWPVYSTMRHLFKKLWLKKKSKCVTKILWSMWHRARGYLGRNWTKKSRRWKFCNCPRRTSDRPSSKRLIKGRVEKTWRTRLTRTSAVRVDSCRTAQTELQQL